MDQSTIVFNLMYHELKRAQLKHRPAKSMYQALDILWHQYNNLSLASDLRNHAAIQEALVRIGAMAGRFLLDQFPDREEVT